MKNLSLADLKGRPEVGWNILLALSVVASLVAVGFTFFAPAPKGTNTEIAKRIRTLEGQRRKEDKLIAEATGKIQAQGWNVAPEALGPKVLDLLTRLSEREHLQLSAFRSERPIEVAQMTEAPFVAVLEGPFDSMVKLLTSLEAPETKLGVNLFQISSTETGLGHVTATVGLVAFLPREVK